MADIILQGTPKLLQLKGTILVDEYITSFAGLVLPTTSSNVGTGSNATFVSQLKANLNGSTQKYVTAIHNKSVSTSTHPSRASQYFNAPDTLRITSTSEFYIEGTWYVTGGLINYTNNPVIQCFGVLPATTFTSNSMAVDGFYFRPPRVGETQFIKFVILQAGVEVITSTPVVFTGSDTGLFRTAVYWNNTDLTWFVVDDSNVYQGTINDLLSTYIFNGSFTYGWHLATLGAQTGTVLYQTYYDSLRRWIPDNINSIV